MSRVVRIRWTSASTGLSRQDSRSRDDEAYAPDLLSGRPFSFAGEVTADLADAEAAVARERRGDKPRRYRSSGHTRVQHAVVNQ